jgi:hypothetical protein
MSLKFITGMMPFLILCCILACMVAANLQGMDVNWSLFALNGFGLVLGIYHGLEFRI